jgi:hypothetical protein
VADQVREHLMPLEDARQLNIPLTALTPKELAALPEGDPWWFDVVRDGRVLKGPAPDQARRRLSKATMTNQGPRQTVDAAHSAARRLQARESMHRYVTWSREARAKASTAPSRSWSWPQLHAPMR